MNQAINEMEVTAEEVEAMDALCRLGAGVPLLNISDGGRTVQYATPQFSPQPSAEVLHKPDVTTIINNICEQLSLLATVINQTKAQPHAEDQSLQECVQLVLTQGSWVKHAINEKVEELLDDKDFSYEIESAVETHFSNSFSLDDHVDITAEVESRVTEIVEEQLSDLLDEKLRNVRITFD
jgi:hypothetical protein